jgi:hypothetical protein
MPLRPANNPTWLRENHSLILLLKERAGLRLTDKILKPITREKKSGCPFDSLIGFNPGRDYLS